jgi:flavin reductase (DIM6/NTAB) family NADH-FMN oxidoreductase RutF
VHLSRHFANPLRPRGRAQLSDVDWWPARGTSAPILDGCLAWFDHTLHSVTLAGDYAVFIGRVIWIRTTTQ